MHDHVGVSQQMFKRMAIVRIGQVEACAALAQHHLVLDAGLIPTVRIDAQHVGTQTGEKTGGDRPGENARQIQHPHAVQRPGYGQRPTRRRRFRLQRGVDQGFERHALALNMLPPRGRRAHLGRTAAGFDHCLLQLALFPAQHARRQRAFIRCRVQHLFHRPPMVRRIGMQAYPAVCRLVVAGQGVQAAGSVQPSGRSVQPNQSEARR